MRSEEIIASLVVPHSSLSLTDRVRFELTIRGYRIPVFETGAFSLSATCPRLRNIVGLQRRVNEKERMGNKD
jgi:hypothetical protein